MTIIGISHTNIGVRDADKCLPFYRAVLGLEVSLDDDDHHQLDGKPYHRRAIYLRWRRGPRESFIVLDQNHAQEAHARPPKLAAIGLNHFGFWVDDMDAILARARAAGVKIMHEPHPCAGRHYGYPDAGEAPYVQTVFLLDPEDNVIQLDQWVKPD